MCRVMSRLPTYPITWITIMFLFVDFAVTGSRRYSGNTSLSNFQGERPAYDLKNVWQGRLSHESDLTSETVGPRSSNGSPCLKSNQAAENTSAKVHRIVARIANRKTLIDYNGPAIMDDPNGKSDQDFANHVRVKRNEPSDSILQRRGRSADSFFLRDSSPPLRNFCSSSSSSSSSNNVATTNGALDDPLSKFGEPYVDSNRPRNLPDGDYGTIASTPHPRRRKRGISSKNQERRKRVKGNEIEHARYRAGTRVRLKKRHDAKPKSSYRHRRRRRLLPSLAPLESANDTLDVVRLNDTDEKVEINEESGASSSINNTSSNETQQRGGNSFVSLPFVHTGKAELRVRIEKMPTNEVSFFNSSNWPDRSARKTFHLVMPKVETIDGMLDATNLKLTTNFDFSESKGANNLTITSILKKIDGNNVVSQETNDSGSTMLHDARFHSALQRIKDNQSSENGETEDRTSKRSTESTRIDRKSRAKRNQEIKTSKNRSRNHRSSDLKESKHLDKAAHKSSRSIKNEQTKTHDRAVRSIEEIRQLADKLIIKVNELQLFVDDHDEALYKSPTKESNDVIVSNDTTSLKKQGDNSSVKSKKHTNKNDCQRSHNCNRHATLVKKESPAFNVSRFARGHRIPRQKSDRKWGRWLDWSSCSVTCGKGRQIRWRHCLRNCEEAETEMEEKTCQYPACPPGRFLGIF